MSLPLSLPSSLSSYVRRLFKKGTASASGIDIASTEPLAWRYVSEGGASAVFSYIGPQHDTFTSTVLRLRKSGNEGLSDEEDDPVVIFQNICMARLIPSVHLAQLRSIRVDSAWLQEFIRLHNESRPEERRESSTVDADRTMAVLADDLVGTTQLAVEIKVRSLSRLLDHAETHSQAEMLFPSRPQASVRFYASC